MVDKLTQADWEDVVVQATKIVSKDATLTLEQLKSYEAQKGCFMVIYISSLRAQAPITDLQFAVLNELSQQQKAGFAQHLWHLYHAPKKELDNNHLPSEKETFMAYMTAAMSGGWREEPNLEILQLLRSAQNEEPVICISRFEDICYTPEDK